MTPKSTTENLLYWSAALAIALLLSFVSGVMTHWAPDGPIDWRGVFEDVGQTILTVVPIVAAGFGLPRLGKEQVANLTSKVGVQNAVDALHDEVDRQAGIPQTILLTPEQVRQVADQLEARMKATPAQREAQHEAQLDDERRADQDVVTGTPPLPPVRED